MSDTPIDELEQRIVSRFQRALVVAALSGIVTAAGFAYGFGNWVARVESKSDAADRRISSVESTVQADAAFKTTVTSSIDVLKERSEATAKAIDRMDNKLDRVIRVYDVPR